MAHSDWLEGNGKIMDANELPEGLLAGAEGMSPLLYGISKSSIRPAAIIGHVTYGSC